MTPEDTLQIRENTGRLVARIYGDEIWIDETATAEQLRDALRAVLKSLMRNRIHPDQVMSGPAFAPENRWPTEEETPATCPKCGIGWDSTDLRRHPSKQLPWWRCSDCGHEWNEVARKRNEADR